jgi:hypothetical protein
MAKESVATRLDPDTNRALEDFAEKHDIGKTEASRRLIRDGLSRDGYDIAAMSTSQTPLERLSGYRLVLVGISLLVLGIALLLLVGATVLGTGAVYVATGALSLGVLSLYLNLVANLALIDDLSGAVFGSSEVDIDD